jgi:hypothetical protein
MPSIAIPRPQPGISSKAVTTGQVPVKHDESKEEFELESEHSSEGAFDEQEECEEEESMPDDENEDNNKLLITLIALCVGCACTHIVEDAFEHD